MNVPSLGVFLTVWLSTSSMALGGDPGLAVVIGEGPEQTVFLVPELSRYKFTYDPSRISLWDSGIAPPGTCLDVPSPAAQNRDSM